MGTPRLYLLKFASGGGYDLVGEVPSGWTMAGGELVTDVLLKIDESADVTEEMLSETIAFALDTAVYKFNGEGRSQPLGQVYRTWTYSVYTDGETYP